MNLHKDRAGYGPAEPSKLQVIGDVGKREYGHRMREIALAGDIADGYAAH